MKLWKRKHNGHGFVYARPDLGIVFHKRPEIDTVSLVLTEKWNVIHPKAKAMMFCSILSVLYVCITCFMYLFVLNGYWACDVCLRLKLWCRNKHQFYSDISICKGVYRHEIKYGYWRFDDRNWPKATVAAIALFIA